MVLRMFFLETLGLVVVDLQTRSARPRPLIERVVFLLVDLLLGVPEMTLCATGRAVFYRFHSYHTNPIPSTGRTQSSLSRTSKMTRKAERDIDAWIVANIHVSVLMSG